MTPVLVSLAILVIEAHFYCIVSALWDMRNALRELVELAQDAADERGGRDMPDGPPSSKEPA